FRLTGDARTTPRGAHAGDAHPQRRRFRRRAPQPAPAVAPAARPGRFSVMLRIVRRPASIQAGALGGSLHPVLSRVYAARGVQRAAELDTSLERLLPVGTLEGIAAAAELLLAHRAAGRVLVVGDFDADGATSCALVVRALRACGFAAVDFL